MGNTRETITVFGYPNRTIVKSAHGVELSYLQWCKCEADRITAAGTLCGVVWNEYGYCAVAEVKAAEACDEHH